MNRILIVTILTLAISVVVSAQNLPPKHGLTIAIGADNFHIKDEYISPLIYRGTVFSVAALYRVAGETTRQTIEADFSTGTLTSAPRQFDAQHYIGALSYTVLFRLHETEAFGLPVGFFGGGGIGSTFWISDYSTPATLQPNGRGDGYLVHGVALAARAEAGLGSGRLLALQASSPVLRLVSRPEYGVVSNRSDDYLYALEHPYTEYFWENPVVQFQAEYSQPVSDSFDFDAVYRFGFNRCDEPLPMSAFSNTFVAGMRWKF